MKATLEGEAFQVPGDRSYTRRRRRDASSKPTGMAAPSRRERAAKSNLKPFAATLVACDGPPRWVAACVLFCFVLGSIAWIGWDIASLRGPALDASWAEFARVVCAWFVLNVALCLLLGVLDARAPGDDTRAAARFREYPLFSWLTPGVQQLVFFWSLSHRPSCCLF